MTQLSVWDQAIAGALGSVWGETLTLPFDTTKVAMQVSDGTDPRLNSVFQTMNMIR